MQSFAYFPRLLSQTTAIIQSPTNSLSLCFLWPFYCQRLVVGGFSALFFKLLPWETGKVKQLMRCHLVNSRLALTCSQTATSTAHTPAFSSILFLLLLHTNARLIVRISHQMPVKLSGAHLCLTKPPIHTCIPSPFHNSIY